MSAASPVGFEEFFRHWLPQLKRYLAWLEADVSIIDDAAQETMASAYRYWEKVGTYDNPKIWLFRVAGQRLSDQREKRRRLALTGDLETLDRQHQDDLARVEAQHQLLPLLRKLPVHQAAPLVLFYYGFSDQEIAEIVGIAPTSARSARCRGMKMLRELAAAQGGSEEAK